MNPEVIFVDDDVEFDAPIYIRAMERQGFRVIDFSDVSSAINYFRTETVTADVAIFDLIMPKPIDTQSFPIPSRVTAGEYVYQEFRKIYPQKWVVLFSAISDYRITTVIDSNDNFMYSLLKTRYPPRDLAVYLDKRHFQKGD